MHIRSLSAIVWSLIAGPLAVVHGQFSMLPQCANDCVNNSGNFNCSALDLSCICGLANGEFLTDIVTCFKTNCDSNLDGLLVPLTVACKLAGHPIQQSAINSAKAATAGSTATSSSAIALSTVTVTDTAANEGQTAVIVSVSTITSTTADSNGAIYYIVVPVTAGSTTTVTGSPSTVSTVSPTTITSTSIAAAAITTTVKDTTSTVLVTSSASIAAASKNGNNGQAGTPFSGAARNGIGGASLLGLAIALLGGMI